MSKYTHNACKVCGSVANLKFALPKSKKTGHPIPDLPNDAPYYECTNCGFLFTDAMDELDHTEIYSDEYWEKQDPDLFGRVSETMRLVLLANDLLRGRSDQLDVLDFGCGGGAFVEIGRNTLQMNVWGTDINPPKLGKEWFLPNLGEKQFDVIVSCEVIEHLPDPKATFALIRSHLKSPGIFAFQTAYWDGDSLDRTWWYLGPDNGHISLYSPKTFDFLANELGASDRRLWKDYPGLQAWRFE